MREKLELYFKNLSDYYAIAIEDIQPSSIALSMIKGIALDFEFDVLKYLSEQIAKGKTEDEKEKIKIEANLKVEEKIERVKILRNAIKSLERLVGREESIRAFISLKNKENGMLLDRIKELEDKIQNMEAFIAKEDE